MRCLGPGGDHRVGVEVEWLVFDLDDPRRAIGAEESLRAADGPSLPGGGTVSVEPGGQLELNGAHGTDLAEVVATTETDASELERRCAAAGLRLVAMGLDPLRTPPRSVAAPRYRAIEVVFDRAGPSPMLMATASAGVQLNVDVGPDPLRTWRLAHLIGPVLVALFANSPLRDGRPTGWASTRQLLWQTVPDRRAEPAPTWSLEAWADHVLDSQVLLIRTDDDAVPITEPLTFRRWIEQGHEIRRPTIDDLDYHLTTLFPPVRPRGWLELRMIDSTPARGRSVAVALAGTILRDEDAGRDAARACLPVAGRWPDAARDACSDPELATAAIRCLTIAAEACGDSRLAAACAEWSDRYPARRRSPADDALERWRTGRLGDA